MAGVDKPGYELRQLLQQYATHDPDLSERIYTLFQLARVRDDNGYINGFTDELLRQSEIDLGTSRDSMPCLLDEKKIAYDYCPGVSAFCGAASALNLEYTLPEISQSVIITRMEGRTAVPEKESIEAFAAHQCSMAIYLSTGMLEKLSERLIKGGYSKDTTAALAYKVSWPEEEIYICTVETLAQTAAEHGITKTALVLVGDVINKSGYSKSRLYAEDFSTEFRAAKKS